MEETLGDTVDTKTGRSPQKFFKEDRPDFRGCRAVPGATDRSNTMGVVNANKWKRVAARGGTQEFNDLLTIDLTGVGNKVVTLGNVFPTVLCGSTQGDVLPESRAVHSEKVKAEATSSP
ncbi:hypothetical protein AB205_0204320 [Aquarana catesbeiana]|uniref:Uncharacterized protein n=1 Tax=Aquarana catesbeiana TaxID=8400 RepID=A0A2G9QIQ8_AQUCT|nr:hypothetical protein AB205_0204320 [Aquarana catesbeiana]